MKVEVISTVQVLAEIKVEKIQREFPMWLGGGEGERGWIILLCLESYNRTPFDFYLTFYYMKLFLHE